MIIIRYQDIGKNTLANKNNGYINLFDKIIKI